MRSTTPETTLSPEQVEHFAVFGFVVLRHWITDGEVETIQRDVAKAMEAAYRASPFDGSKRQWVPMTGPASPTLRGFLEDRRFWDASERLLGAEVVPLVVDANRYVGDTGWHSDTSPTIKNEGTKFAIYLDSLTADAGALRFVPGSHRPPLHDGMARLADLGMLEPGASVPAYAAEVHPGDVVAFNWPTWHASFGGRPDRRMCTVDFFSLANDADAIRTQMRNNAAMHRRAWGHREGFPYYDPTWIENAEGSARRQELIDRMRTVGIFEAAAAGEASVEPSTPSPGR